MRADGSSLTHPTSPRFRRLRSHADKLELRLYNHPHDRVLLHIDLAAVIRAASRLVDPSVNRRHLGDDRYVTHHILDRIERYIERGSSPPLLPLHRRIVRFAYRCLTATESPAAP